MASLPLPAVVAPVVTPEGGLSALLVGAGIQDPGRAAAVRPAVEPLRALAAWGLAGGQELPDTTAAVLTQLLERMPVAAVGLDRADRVTFWNPAAERLFGWRREEVLGRPVRTGGPPSPGEVDHLLRSVATAPIGRVTELAGRHRDGTIRTIRLHRVPLGAEAERPVQTITLVEDITARRTAEAELASFHATLADLVHWAPVAIVEYDLTTAWSYVRTQAAARGVAVPELLEADPSVLRGVAARLHPARANAAALELLGESSVRELRSAPDRAFLEETLAGIREVTARFLSGERVVHGIEVPLRLHGELRWVVASVSAGHGGVSSPPRALVALSDVTELHAARARLARRETVLRELARRTESAVGRHYLETLVAALGELADADLVAVAELPFPSREEMDVVAWVLDGVLQRPTTWPVADTPIDRVLRSGLPLVISGVPPAPIPGSSRPGWHGLTTFAGVPLRDRTGRCTGLLFVMARRNLEDPRHVTALLETVAGRVVAELERQRREAHLRESEARYRELVEAAAVAIASCDAGGEILFANPALGELVGHRPSALLGRRFPDLCVPEDRDRAAALLAAASAPPAQTPPTDLRLLRGDGTVRVVEVVPSSVRRSSGPPMVQIYLLDVTEAHQLRAELLRAQRVELLGRLTGGIAHDLNNVLQALSLNLQLARLEAREGTQLSARLEAMDRAVRRGEGITRQLLSFSRSRPTELRPVALDELVDGLLPMLRRLIPEDVAIEVEHGDAPAVEGDPGQLEQVVMNLVINARDALPEGGTITLRTRSGGPPDQAAAPAESVWAWLEVTDTGEGISPEHAQRIFDPFFTTKPEGSGTGLGLAIVQRVVRRHGGTVEVEARPDGGTVFRVALPPAAPGTAGPDLEERAVKTAAVADRHRTVLVAEDEEELRGAIADGLRAAGYRVLTARDGAEAVEVFEREPGAVDAAVLDVVMPRLGGPAAAEAMRRTRPGLPVLFLSGHDPDGRARRAPAGRGSAFLPKPAPLAAIVNALEELLAAGG